MKEQKNIVQAFKALSPERTAALATVVRVHGSSYRSPGARMLITDDGKWVGSISGGCLEGDALRKARKVMSDHQPVTVTYDTREESNQHLGIGLGCNGVIDVLIEPLHSQDLTNSVLLFEKVLDNKEPVALATIFNGSAIVLWNCKKILKGKMSIVLGLIESLKRTTFSFKIFFRMVNVCTSEHYLS